MSARSLTALIAAIAATVALSGCSGGGGSSGTGGTGPGGSAPGPGAGPGPGPGTIVAPPSSTSCSLRARQTWAAEQLNEWYLFPETLPATLDPAPYSSVQDYLDALTATARSQGRDRFFTYIDSIAEEDAFFRSGQTAAFGIRIQTDAAGRRVLVADAYENAPALAAGIDRGAEILAIGTNPASLRSVQSIIAAEGAAGVSDALGPATAGTTRALEISDSNGRRIVTIAKATFDIRPVSNRFGAQVLTDNGRRVGYLNLRTFIDTADPQLRDAFATFRAQGITDFIIDFRYNGGGLVDIADLMGDLLGDNRASGDVFETTEYRPSKAQFNETRRFRRQPQSVAPVRIAFITTSASASASELVINSMQPWLRDNLILVGSNTFGKPVGQIARDRTACDDRLRVVAFETRNADRQGGYYNGLAGTVPRSCAAQDEIGRPMGDPQEASTRAALDALGGASCAAIGSLSTARSAGRRQLLVRERPSVVDREVPGTF
jgi:C-terminal processing protease CtpA/Prc